MGHGFGTERRARRLQDHRRRQDVEADAVPRQQDRRGRARLRPEERERRLHRAVGIAALPVGHVERRSGQRPVQVDRRRRELERDHQEPGLADRTVGQGRHQRVGRRQQPRLRADRERTRGRPVSSPTTRARRGRRSTTTATSASARSTTRASTPIRRSRTPSGS